MAIQILPATVADLMTAHPVVVSVDCSLTEAAELLDFYGITGLPVVDRKGQLAGVVSQTDIVRAEADYELRPRWERLLVSDVMTRPALTVKRETTVERAVRLMSEQRVHRLVVTDGDDNAVGIITMSDLVRALAEDCEGRPPLALDLSVEYS
jgi:CBS domain-containing protein